MRRNRRAQNQQVFVFILGAIIMAAVLLLGVRFVKNTLGKSEEALEVNFINDVKNKVESMETDFGSIDRKPFKVSSETQEVCFVDLNCVNNSVCQDKIEDIKNLLVREEAKVGENNFFIVKDEGVPVGDYVGKIRLHEETGRAHQCIKPISGKVTIEFEGVKGGVAIYNTSVLT